MLVLAVPVQQQRDVPFLSDHYPPSYVQMYSGRIDAFGNIS